MAIFNKSDTAHQNTKSNSSSDTTIITAGSKIKGEMNVSCQLFIDGLFEGSIISDKEINIGSNGHVIGEIKTDRLVVQGSVEGNIDANKVEIKASGRVNGTIESVELLIESKGIFEGSSILKKNDVAAIASKVITDKK